MSWPYTRRSQRILLWSISPRTDEEEGQSFSNGRAARRGYPFLPRPPSGGCTVHRVPPLRGDNLSLMYKTRMRHERHQQKLLPYTVRRQLNARRKMSEIAVVNTKAATAIAIPYPYSPDAKVVLYMYVTRTSDRWLGPPLVNW